MRCIVFFFILVSTVTFIRAETNIDSLKQVLKEVELADDSTRCSIVYELYFLYQNQNSDSTNYYLHQLDSIAQQAQIPYYQQLVAYKKARFFYNQSDYHKADSLFNLVLNYKNLPLRLRSMEFLAHRYMLSNELEQAKLYVEQYEQEADSLGALYYNLLAQYQTAEGKIIESLENSLIAYRYASKNKDVIKSATILLNIANTYQDIGNYERSLAYYKESLALTETAPEYAKARIVHWYNYMNMAYSYLHLDLLDSVHYVCNRAYTIRDTYDTHLSEGYLYAIQATAFLEQNLIDTALITAHKGVTISIANNEVKELADCYESIAKIHLEQKKYREALYYAEQMEMNFPAYIPRLTAPLKAKIYKGLGQWQNAYESLDLIKLYKDSIHQQQSIVKINSEFLNYRFEQEKKQKELETAKNEALYSAELANERSMRNLFVVVSLLASGILVLIYHSRQFIQQQKEELVNKTNKLETLNSIKNRIFYIIGHDLRSPISSFDMLITSVLNRQMSMEEFSSFLPKLKQNISEVALTLNNMLQWGLLQDKQPDKQPLEDVNLHQEVENVRDFLAVLLRQKDLHFENAVKEDIHVYANSHQVNLIFRNLISNSIKFTSKSGIIKVAAEANDQNIEISIQDSGIGISKERQQAIFNGTNNSTTGTNGEKGTGLGLLLCKEFVEKWGGKIWIESVEEKGSTFRFSIPI